MHETGYVGLRFHAELRPNRSGTLAGVHKILGFLLLVFIPAGTAFSLAGAWPVFGFMGGELVLLYVALRLGLRRSRTVESIFVSERDFVVQRINHWGETRRWTFQPQWLQVEVENPEARNSRLKLRSRGKQLIIGAFLTPAERLEVADALRAALVDLNPARA